MATTITCAECGDTRTAAFKNTKYCVKCALLRDLTFVGDRTYKCDDCKAEFAPLARRDPYCGNCAFGCGKFEDCVGCAGTAELHRPGVPLCTRCLRDPKQRRKIIRALRGGQQERRIANQKED